MSSYYEKFLATGAVKCIDEEIPFEVPKGWEWCRMGSIGEWGAGATPAKGNLDYYNGNILWLRTGELNNDVVYNTEIKITEKALRECSLRLNKIGDVMIAMYGATIGKVAIVGKEMTTNQACCACTPIGVFNWFLFYFLMASQIDFIKKGEGGAQPNISREKLIKHLMPVPPIEEQQRIVLRIREVLPYVDKYAHSQDAHNHLNQSIRPLLRKSILQEAIQGKLVTQDPSDEPASMLLQRIRDEKQRLVKKGELKKKDVIDSIIYKGDDNKYYEKCGKNVTCIDEEIPFEIPKSWRWSRIKSIFQTSSGGTPEKGHSEYYGGNIPWVRVGDLESKYLSKVEGYITELGLQNSSAKIFPKGTILVAMYCNDAIGKSSILSIPMTTNQAICGLFPNELINTEYIYYAIQANRKKLQEQSAGGAQKNINQKIVNNLLFPLPPLAEQQRIVAKIEQALTSIMRE